MGGCMRYICEAPGGRAWFRIETEAEAEGDSAAMRHAVEKYFRNAKAKATETYRPVSTVLFEQEIGLKAHIQREMPIFLTLRNDDGEPIAALGKHFGIALERARCYPYRG